MRALDRLTFRGSDGNMLVADALGAGNAPVILLLHGGGQTRRSWESTQRRFAGHGYRAIAFDARGHGESQWVDREHYELHHYADDLAAILTQLGQPQAYLVGASLGGMASLLAIGEKRVSNVRALVLADVVHRPERVGADNIRSFMDQSVAGFATLDEAADAVALYLAHRERPASLDALARKMHQGDDGRWRWQWDPAFLRSGDGTEARRYASKRLEASLGSIDIPVLLLRGEKSEIVSDILAQEFLGLVPSATMAVVAGATHMISSDDNDAFTAHILTFLASSVR